MGAYGYRGFYERKTHFLQSVPYAIRNLEWLLEDGAMPVPLPALGEALQRIVASTHLREIAPVAPRLTVRIESFSYHRGYPADTTGHGGGFVFDCRALPNPGREPGFVNLTGRDPAVIAWLEQYDEPGQFLAQIRSLLEPTLEAYQQRHFTHLTVAFGCTGGQHRSVYCAEALARSLRGAPGHRGGDPSPRSRSLAGAEGFGSARSAMKAMVFAAGRGTRLRPLTDTRPKALVEVAGRTLLEHVLRRLVEAGVTEVIINLHHLRRADFPPFLEKHDRFGLRRVAYSEEPVLLDTGGGLKQAAWFFDDGNPFLVHNVDVLSDIDLGALLVAHRQSAALATLAVMARPTARPLYFDAAGRLVGRRSPDGSDEFVRVPEGAIEPVRVLRYSGRVTLHL